ncbi:hypothetical protein FAES_5095 [Fibrella aestuarina BUZ 2]|uniref:Uncharacterized protein n=1 Tax=Fibrella aestuarina BUZ 2 TaxID=1166018 RepID=I0KG41_9BACT|nr:hypothetical protein [Fibrella aestuarina]CCH03094.1 hypothetical protein FAES_5095 [Fibrella aestuarina BUZ 2]
MKRGGLLLVALLMTLAANAQVLSFRISGNPTINVSNTADYANGVTLSHNTLQMSLSALSVYSLQVKAAGNLNNGMYSIPVSQVRLRVTNLSGATGGVTLNTAYQTLASFWTLLPAYNVPVTIEYKLAGGQEILRPGGAYTTTLTFLLTAQ